MAEITKLQPKLPQHFDPQKTSVTVKSLGAIIEKAKRIRDWAKRDDGIDALIAEQQAFVTWWGTHVTPGEMLGKNDPVAKAQQGIISVDEATQGTGISKFQVSKWRVRLIDVEGYKTDLRKAAWRWAWSGKRGGRVLDECGADVPPNLLIGDFRDVLSDLEEASVDLIFTDPPYDAGHVHLYEDLAKFGARVLKPGGSLLAYCGHYAIPDLCKLMLPYLRWHWLLAEFHDGGATRCLPGADVKVLWKPILWLTNGSINQDRDIVMDAIWRKTPDKSHDSWSQSAETAVYYISRLTDVGDLIVDPFAGCCTTLIACKQIGRNALGAEIDPEVARVAADRMEKR